MSIKISDIKVKKKEVNGAVEYNASITLSNSNSMDIQAFMGMNKSEVANSENYIARNLKMSIIAHTYGDLIDPINAIAMIATSCELSNHQKKAIETAKLEIAGILTGLEQQVEAGKEVGDHPLIHLN